MHRYESIFLVMSLCLPLHGQVESPTSFQLKQNIQSNQSFTLPSVFDLRDVEGVSYVTGVRSQTGGTCWAHGVIAAMESNLLMTGVWSGAGESGEPDLAEYHLDWWNGFNDWNNDDISPPSGQGLTVHQGGDYRVAAAYLARGEGAVRDSDAQSFADAPSRHDDSFHYYYVRDIEWYYPTTVSDIRHIIKQKVMDFGAVGTAMTVYNKCFSNGFTYYLPPHDSADPNHAVAIVGWNDTLSTAASGPGAWLCKNSWGSGWGLDGYFWIAYEDKHCGRHPEMGAVSFQNVEPFRYDHIYTHDYHGWRDSMKGCNEAFNAFTALSDEILQAVSFYTVEDSADYKVCIFDRFADGELGDTLACMSGRAGHVGFHTVDLTDPILLSEGDDFYVCLQLSTGGMPYDRTSEVKVLLGSQTSSVWVTSTAHPGESYYHDGVQWIDLYNEDPSANFCIKALTVKQPETDIRTGDLRSSVPSQFHLGQNMPNPFNNATVIRYQIPNTCHVSLCLFDLSGREVADLVNATQSAGFYSIRIHSRDLPSGLYLYRLQAGDQIAVKKMLIAK